MLEDETLRLPENCAVRLIDLEPGIGGLIAVGEDGFVNIYLNARESRDAQERALRHELRHYFRGDLYSDTDIREVERLADLPEPVLAIDGTPLEATPPGFDPGMMRRAGRGLYMPRGDNLARAAADIARIRALLGEACLTYDVMQVRPSVHVDRLRDLVGGLCPEDIAFFVWQPPGLQMSAALRFFREAGDRLHGAIYYDVRGRLDNALAVFEVDDARITVDIRRRKGALALCAIGQEAGDGDYRRIY